MFKASDLPALFLVCLPCLSLQCFAQNVVTSTTMLSGPTTVPIGGANGVAATDANGQVPVSELGNVASASAASIVTAVLFQNPSWATLFANLQNASGNPGTWTTCAGLPTVCGGGGQGTGSYTLGIASPSLSGAAMMISATNATYTAWNTNTPYAAGATASYNGVNYYALVANTGAEPDTNPSDWHTSAGFNLLTYRHLGCTTLPGGVCVNITHATYDIYFYIPSGSGIQALEFDPDFFIGGWEYFLSMQCDSATGDWKFWNMSGGTWTLQTSSGGTLPIYPCKVLSETNAWHHLQLQGSVSTVNHTYAYQSFAIDGVPVYSNLGNTYNAASYTGSDGVNVEFQLDLTAAASSAVTAYYDLPTLGLW